MSKRKRQQAEADSSELGFDDIARKFDAFVSTLNDLIESTPEKNFSTKGLDGLMEDKVVIAKVLKRMRLKGQLSWMEQYLEDEDVPAHSHPSETASSNVTSAAGFGTGIESNHIARCPDESFARLDSATSVLQLINLQETRPPLSQTVQVWPPILPTVHDQDLLRQAFTHRSYATASAPAQSTKVFLTSLHNERLEFLGDSFLNHSVTKMLFSRMPDAREGELSLLRAELIGNTTAAAFGKLYELDKQLLLNDTAERDGVRKTPKVIADTFEAYLGAIVLDGPDGVIRADTWIRELMTPRVTEYLANQVREAVDVLAKQKVWNHFIKRYPAMTVHEDGATRPAVTIKYEWVDGGGGNEGGFIVAAKVYHPERKVDGYEVGRGFGLNKKEAEHRAAMDAVRKLGLQNKYWT